MQGERKSVEELVKIIRKKYEIKYQMIGPDKQRNTLWDLIGGCCPQEPGQLLRRWRPFFRHISTALNLAVIDTVMRDVSVDIDRHLMSDFASPD